jgi:poly(3-hydroxybutyrate) depolymerase
MKPYVKTFVFLVGSVVLPIFQIHATPNAALADFLARSANYNGSGNAYPYRLFVPDGYNLPENATRQYPVVLFLHGLGERGTNNSSQVTGAGAPVLGLVTGTNRDSYPAFILCPQIPTSVEWGWGDSSGGVVYNTRQIIEILRSEFRVDPSRISVAGLSLGAMGTWAQLQVFPNYYAAALPMSWSNTSSNAGSAALFAQMSLWVFYGDQDSYRYTNYNDPANDVNTTRAAGGYVVFSRYPDGTHGTSTWGTAGNTRGLYTPGLMQWLTGQQKGVANTTQAPLISLATPATGSTYSTASTTLNLTGAASDAMGGGLSRTISGLTWTNDRGGSGSATGTTSWAINSIPILSGVNKIQILATDNQNTTFNRLLTVTQGPTNALQTWKNTNFGVNVSNPLIAGDTADPDGDGISNLTEYALGGNPNSAATTILPVISVPVDRLQVAFTRLAPTDVTYVVQASGDLSTWTDLATLTANSTSWTGAAMVSETGSGATRNVTVQDTVLTTAGTKRFFRLKITNP